MNTLIFYNCIAATEGTPNFEYNQGGFTATETSNITIIGMVNFINNSVTPYQNALTVFYSSRLTICGTTVFAGNILVGDNEYTTVYVESSTNKLI